MACRAGDCTFGLFLHSSTWQWGHIEGWKLFRNWETIPCTVRTVLPNLSCFECPSLDAAVRYQKILKPSGCKAGNTSWSGLQKTRGKHEQLSFEVSEGKRLLLNWREWHGWYTQRYGKWYQKSHWLWTSTWFISCPFEYAGDVPPRNDTPESDISAQNVVLHSGGDFVYCMKWHCFEKVVRMPDERRAERTYSEPFHGNSEVVGGNPPVDAFEDSDMSGLAGCCKQKVVYGGQDPIFTQIDNWVRWERALTRHPLQ